MLNKKKQIIFTIIDDEKGFTLSTKLKGDVKMDHFKAVASYMRSKCNEYAAQVNKADKEARRAAYMNKKRVRV
jgi:predicted DNA-binding protein (MmcQ/YjbR family)